MGLYAASSPGARAAPNVAAGDLEGILFRRKFRRREFAMKHFPTVLLTRWQVKAVPRPRCRCA